MDSTSHTIDDGDVSKHFVISKGIRVRYKKRLNISPRLEATLNGQHVVTEDDNLETVDDRSYDWNLENEIHMFRGDILTFQVAHGGKRKRWFNFKARDHAPEKFEIPYGNISDIFKGQEQVSFSGKNCDLIIKVAVGYVSDTTNALSIQELDPLLPESVQNVIDSSESFLQFANTAPLKSILENIPITEDALQALENVVVTLGDAHPLAKAVLTALSIPYNLLKNEREFKKNVKDLADVMHVTCRCLLDVRYHTKIPSAKELFVSIMKTLRDAALFITNYRTKGRIGQFVGAQFSTRLEGFAEDLIKQKNDFQMAMVLQIARDVDKMPSMTHDYFLQKRLKPIEVQPLDEGCLKGTRVKILDEVKTWLQDESQSNILWIVGAPGAGKSTIATTIAKELSNTPPFCAKFFCKRDVPELRNPRQIWRALAYSLADKHDGVKAALMRMLEENKGDIQDSSVIENFEGLIKGPLETVKKETSFRSQKSLYPLVIIDALDECFSADDVEWDNLLESLGNWAQLPRVFKLIVTSRDFVDIRQTLGEVSYCIDLTTGDDVSKDSKHDVEIFFVDRFASIMKKHPSFKLCQRSTWPDEKVIGEFTAYAAGLFVWADMVVKYIGLRTGGSDPDQRLRDVLSDIRSQLVEQRGTVTAPDGRGQVDRIYARIIFEAFRRSNPDEREKAKRCLAAILLAKEPLPKSSLIELLSMDASTVASLESTLYELSPIISDATGMVRVCHKTVTDFLLSHERSAIAMKHVARRWDRPDDEVLDSFILSYDAENGHLSSACLRLLDRSFSKSVDSIISLLNRPNGSLSYASRYWLAHLERAGTMWTMVLPNFRGLADEMEIVYKCLGRHFAHLTSSKEDTLALAKCFSDAANFVSECIMREQLAPASPESPTGDSHIVKLSNITQDIDKYALDISNVSNAFLRKWLEPFDQTPLDDECLKGTRRSILRTAKDWLEDPNQRNILWIFGAPGAGKSTIATSLVKEFSRSKLCAKAFVKRDYADRRDPTRVWQTLAYNLASLHVGLKGSIIDALYRDSRHRSNAVEDQIRLREFIVKALQVQHHSSVVFVIDALDECFTEDNEQWRALLQTLANLPHSFKLVVTSRDIADIQNALENVSYPIRLSTGNDTSNEEQQDTKTFLREQLAGASSTQLSEELLEELAGYASGSFIWAKMIAGLAGKLDSVGSVKDILGGVHGVGDLDALYGKMLLDALGPLDENSRGITRSFLAAIVLAKDPLRKSDLVDHFAPSESFLDDRRQLVDGMVEELSSIISVGNNETLRIPHKSFSDFLLDYDRSFAAMKLLLPQEDPHSYLISRKEDSANIAMSCLRLMNSSLKFNMCRVETSHSLNDDIPELEARISEKISSILIYACQYWADHLKDCNHDNEHFRTRVEPLLETFLFKKFLYWLETRSLTKAILSAKRSLGIAVGVLEAYGRELAGMARDALLFVNRFEKPITVAAPHIYLSALPFSPSNSRIARIYTPQYPGLLSVVLGRRIGWDAAPTTDNAHGGAVNAVAFSPDGSMLVSAPYDKTVRVWDPKTGQPLSAPFTGLKSSVWSIAVSPDGSRIASGGKRGILRIWDSDTGTFPLGSIKAHSDVICSVAFSPDGSRIATGSMDKTVKVWNVATGDLCLGPLTGHTDYVTSVAFSPDGTVIASGLGSHDDAIRIWDAHTGGPRGKPLTTDLVLCVAFSPDGRHLASGSADETIRLWDVAQGFKQISVTAVGSWVRSISFSPDSSCLVSGSEDGTLRLWNVDSDRCEQIGTTIYGHAHRVRSVAFAPDGMSVASGSGDNSIKVWTIPTSSVRPPVQVASTAILESVPLKSSVLKDESFIDEDGWMRTSRRDGASILFWVPEENRGGMWWPRNTVVIHQTVTKFDFRHFVHGNSWAECCSELEID